MVKSDKKPPEEIIAAAYSLLGEKGYDATTIKEIARVAGVAPGLIHYYFPNKDALLLAVLEEAATRYTAALETLITSMPAENAIAAAFDQTRKQVDREPEWYRLRYELLSLGLRNPQLQSGLTALLASGRQCIGQAVQKITGMSADRAMAIAPVLLACFDGLALQRLADPNFDAQKAYQVLQELFQSQLVADGGTLSQRS